MTFSGWSLAYQLMLFNFDQNRLNKETNTQISIHHQFLHQCGTKKGEILRQALSGPIKKVRVIVKNWEKIIRMVVCLVKASSDNTAQHFKIQLCFHLL